MLTTADEEQFSNFTKQTEVHIKESARHLEYALDMVYKALQIEKELKNIAFLSYAKDSLTEIQLDVLALQTTLKEAYQELKI